MQIDTEQLACFERHVLKLWVDMNLLYEQAQTLMH